MFNSKECFKYFVGQKLSNHSSDWLILAQGQLPK
jgi:hypothetical protein